MKKPRAIWGGLGNMMFQMAALYSMTSEFGTDWYCQDERWFIKYKDDIKKLYGSGIVYDHRIGIHVRRTDMVDSNFDIDLSATDYYKRAMELFPKEHFIVFSDDIAWCKEQELFKGCEFSEGKQDWEDLNLLAGCKAIIMANSSFSWWAAYLNPYNKKVIICPEFEYVDHVERRIRPKEWLRL
jgi:hypothetical protein